jgi:O-antigen/teichoic acid export membrane protein
MVVGLAFGYHSRGLHLLAWMLLNQVLASVILYFRANLAGLHRFNIDSIFSVLDRGLMILFCGLLLWGNFLPGPFRIEWFIYAQSLAYGLTAVLAFYAVFRYSKFFAPNFNTKFLRVILKESYPYALLSILMTLYTRIDALMIERMLPDGKVQAGIYAKAYRLLDAENMVAFLFATILLPVFSGMIRRKEPVQKTAATTYSLLMVPSFLLALASFWYRNEIMQLMYHGKVDPFLANVFGCLMFTQLAISTVYIYGTLLTANGNLKFLNIVSAAGLILNILLNFILIPFYGALGAVVATLATQLLVSSWQMARAFKIFGIKIRWMSVLKTIAFMVCSLASFYYLKPRINSWALGLVILFFINLTFALILKLIRVKFLLQLLKLKNE